MITLFQLSRIAQRFSSVNENGDATTRKHNRTKALDLFPLLKIEGSSMCLDLHYYMVCLIFYIILMGTILFINKFLQLEIYLWNKVHNI